MAGVSGAGSSSILGKPELILGRQPDDMGILNRLAGRLLGGIDDEVGHRAALDFRGAPDYRKGLGCQSGINSRCSLAFSGHHGNLSFDPNCT